MAINQDETESTTICSLPTEILEQVLNGLARKDVKALRTMNDKLCTAASDKLFRTITIRNTERSRIELGNIASTPFWASQVHFVNWLSFIADGGRTSFGADTPGFDIAAQSQLLRKLPNVTKVRFATRAIPRWVSIEYNGDSLLDIIPRAGFQQAVVVIGSIPTKFGYTANGAMGWLEIGAADPGLVIVDVGGSGITGNNFGGEARNAESTEMTESIQHFVTANIARLRRISIQGVCVRLGFLSAALQAQSQFLKLDLENVLLASDLGFDTDPLHQLLTGWAEHTRQHHNGTIVQLALENVRKEEHTGSLTALAEEIASWVEGTNEDWLKSAQAGFRQVEEESSGDDYWGEHGFSARDYDIDDDSDY